MLAGLRSPFGKFWSSMAICSKTFIKIFLLTSGIATYTAGPSRCITGRVMISEPVIEPENEKKNCTGCSVYDQLKTKMREQVYNISKATVVSPSGRNILLGLGKFIA